MKPKIIYSEILKAAWKGYKSQCWILMGLIIGFTIIYSLLLLFTIPVRGVTVSISGIVVSVVCLLLSGLFYMGYLKNCLQTLDEEEPQFSAYGQVSGKLLPFIAAGFLYFLITAVGFALLLVPGIYLALRLQYCYALIVDENCGVIESLKRSWNITQGHVMRLFVLFLIQFLICIIGVIALGIGIFVAVPLVALMYSYSYRKLTSPMTE